MTPRPKWAPVELAGGAARKPSPRCAWRTTSGANPVPVTALLPVAVPIVQPRTFAETPGPPIAMKWTTYPVALLVVQLSVKLVASQDCRSASASTVGVQSTMVNALFARRRPETGAALLLRLAAAADLLVVPSVMPNASRKFALKLSFVLPSVQRMRALGVCPRPWGTTWA